MKGGRPGTEDREACEERGLSSVIGLVILLGVVAIAAVSILLVGGGQTTELQDRATGGQAEAGMEQLRDGVGSLVSGTDTTARAEFPATDDEYVTVRNGSRIEVVVKGLIDEQTSTCTYAASLGSLRYRTTSGTLGYEANGIFRLQDGNSVVVQNPSLAYRTVEVDGAPVNTLDVPVVDVRTASGGVGGDDITVAEDVGASGPELCAGETPLDHVDNATVRIENSDFYEAWYDYFVEEFGYATKYDANRTVVVYDAPLGRVNPGTEQSMGQTKRTGELLRSYSNSSYAFRTIHEVNWEIGTGTRSVTNVTIDYEDDSVDLSYVDEEDINVFYVSSTNLRNYDPTHNRTTEIATVEVRDNGSTLYVEFEEDLAGSGGGTGSNAHFVAQYRNVRNPKWGGNYSVNISLNGGTRGHQLNITGPERPRDDTDGDGIPDDVDECPNTPGATGQNGCAALSVAGNDDALRVNQSSGELVLLGSEFVVRNETARTEERSAKDVVLALDRSGSMAYANYTYPAWRSVDDADEDWSDRLYVNNTSIGAGTYRVPDNEVWEVTDCDGSCNATTYEPGDEATLESDEYVRYRYRDGDAVFPVPEGKTLLLRDTDGDASGAQFAIGSDGARWAAPGESVDTTEWEYYLPATPGNDPDRKRVAAAKGFVDALDDSKDRGAFVDFNANGTLETPLTGDLTALKGSITGEAWGATSITAGLETATDELDANGASDHDGVVVLVSDGENSDLDDSGSNADENERTREVAAAAKAAGYTVYTVGLGANADEALLKEVGGNAATMNGSDNTVTPSFYYDADSADDLSAAFDRIAGTVNEEIRRVEYRNTTATVNIDTRSVDLGSATGLDAPGTVTGSVAHDVGSLLSFESTTYECDAWTTVGTVTNPDTGETYDQVRCTSRSTVEDTYGNDTGTLHRIYTAADSDLTPPADYDGNWYVDGVTEIVESYRDGLIEDGEFDLAKNEAIFVVGNGEGNFSVVYYRADDTNDDYYTDGVGPGGMATSSNTYVVDVSGTRVVVCDGNDDADECSGG